MLQLGKVGYHDLMMTIVAMVMIVMVMMVMVMQIW